MNIHHHSAMIYKKIEKNYIYINITLLLLSIYVIFFPMISEIIQKIIPQFGKCPYLMITGKNCPLCGGTRYIKNLPEALNDITYLLNPFGIIIIAVMIEIIFRSINIIKCKNTKQKSLEKTIKFDIILHSIEIIGLILYEILFFII